MSKERQDEKLKIEKIECYKNVSKDKKEDIFYLIVAIVIDTVAATLSLKYLNEKIVKAPISTFFILSGIVSIYDTIKAIKDKRNADKIVHDLEEEILNIK